MRNLKNVYKKDINITKSRLNQKFTNQQNQTCCEICGKEIKGKSNAFHKSHTVPYFCLENIKGYYKKNYGVLKANYTCYMTPYDDEEFIGINKAGVFYSICSTCDQKKFQIYESEQGLLNSDPMDLVDSLSLKIYLNELFNTKLRNFKANIDFKSLTDEQIISSFFNSIGKIEKSTVEVDLKDFQNNLNFAKSSFEKNYRNYKILYYSILDYTVPVAAQVSIPVSKNIDFSELQIVTIENKKRLEDILVCIFPLKEKSVIIVFTRIDNKLIKKYNVQFKKLSEEDKLKEIFYLLIRYKASNYFYSPLLKEILKNKNILEISNIEDTIIKTNIGTFNIADFEDQSLKEKLPSILSREYSIQNLSSNEI